MTSVVNPVAFMNVISPVAWLLVCLLSVFNAGALLAAPTQEKSSSNVSEVKSQTGPVAKKATHVKHSAPAKKPTSVKKRAPTGSQSRLASEVASTSLPPAKLDLSLPPEMVKLLQPAGTQPLPKRTPLLPPMFGEKPKDGSPFQLNGRLLNNEMQLQRRSEERRDVDGAALDFEFKQ